MKFTPLILFILLSNLLFAQECDCASQFSFVRTYFEENSPAFQKIKNNPLEYSVYLSQVKQLNADISKEKSNDRCNLYFEKYVALLKDHHSGIGFDLQRINIDFSSDEQVDSFKSTKEYKAFKKVKIDTTNIKAKLKLKKYNNIEGIYTNGGNLIFGIIKNKKNYYTGVVLRKNRLLDVGHVLLELKKKSETTFESIFHIGLMGFNFQSLYHTIEIKEGQIPVFGFFKSGEKSISETKSYDFKILDEKTNYIKLSSFNGSLKDELNMFYDSIEEKITSKPYLIIDLRDNGGGSEQCYFNLLPYIYTKPLQIDSVEVWVSPENIKRYEENPSDFNSNLIARMKQAEPFTFIPQVENAVTTWVLDSVTTYPQKIVLLFNKNTASAAEGLITYSMQSDKVVTMGENSGGYIGYGNVMETKIPCGKFTLKCTTTKYSKNSKYEFIGIEPMHLLSPKKDWLNYAQSFLHNQK